MLTSQQLAQFYTDTVEQRDATTPEDRFTQQSEKFRQALHDTCKRMITPGHAEYGDVDYLEFTYDLPLISTEGGYPHQPCNGLGKFVRHKSGGVEFTPGTPSSIMTDEQIYREKHELEQLDKSFVFSKNPLDWSSAEVDEWWRIIANASFDSRVEKFYKEVELACRATDITTSPVEVHIVANCTQFMSKWIARYAWDQGSGVSLSYTVTNRTKRGDHDVCCTLTLSNRPVFEVIEDKYS